jgi:hypothetical protein
VYVYTYKRRIDACVGHSSYMELALAALSCIKYIHTCKTNTYMWSCILGLTR